MVKKLLITMILSGLIGCATSPTVVTHTIIQKVNIPIPECPAPPIVEKPILGISKLTDDQQKDIGELSKGYAISLKQTEDYANQLLVIIKKYDDISKNNPVLTPETPSVDSNK